MSEAASSPGNDPDPAAIALEDIDVSRAALYGNDTWAPYFARLRAEDPIHYCQDSVTGPYWSVTRHADIKYVDTHHDIFSSELGGISIAEQDAEPEVQLDNFIAMDPPKHDAQRKAVSPSVAPTNLKNLEPLIRERAADILDNLPVGKTFNWVQDVSVELTARMLATLFDFPYEDRDKLIYWSDLVTASPQLMEDAAVPVEIREKALNECAATFMGLWQERAAQPRKFDLVSMMAHEDSTKDMIERPTEFIGNLMLLIVGGNDTTRNTISGGVLALNQYPDEYQKLRDNPQLIPNMVSEMVRWQTSVIHMRRTALVDTELGGKTIKAGDKVVMWYLSGNHDESVFADAHRLLIDRKNARQHVSFGFGIHRCMGNRLAEMQLRVLWEEIMQRFHSVEVVGEVVRNPNNFIRGITQLPVRLHPI